MELVEDLIQRDLNHIWHPCSQMKDYETFKPLVVTGARGSYIELQDGRRLIDANSSWWCKSLGHGHPRLRRALMQQAERFEHVILANTTNDIIVALSEKLCALTQNLDRVAYASDGVCAIEMAIKMSLHSRTLMGQSQRCEFAALGNGYHGETCTVMGFSDLGLYNRPYQALLPKVHFIQDIPYVTGRHDPLWHDCSEKWLKIEAQLNARAEHLTAILVEPIVQGAGGMLLYSQDFLKRLRQWTQEHDVHLIADEVMTGLGRTGLPLASQQADIEPDFLCLGKGLTGGWLPLSAVLTSSAIYELFYDDYERGKSFLHSHTFAGNPLSAAVAVECLTVLEEENIYSRVQDNENYLLQLMQQTAEQTGKLQRVRGIGAIVAADLVEKDTAQRTAYQIYQKAVELGALLRPIGNTLYWLPPLNCERETLNELQSITQQAILSVMDHVQSL